MKIKSINTLIAICLIAIISFSFSTVQANSAIKKNNWCSFVIHVYAYGSGCSSPQSGAKVTVSYSDGSHETVETDSNGDAAFNCNGTNINVSASFGGHHGTACSISGNNGTVTNVCLNDVTC